MLKERPSAQLDYRAREKGCVNFPTIVPFRKVLIFPISAKEFLYFSVCEMKDFLYFSNSPVCVLDTFFFKRKMQNAQLSSIENQCALDN